MAGVTVVEYALLAATIALGLLVAAGRIGTALDDTFGTLSNCLGSGTCLFNGGGGEGNGGGNGDHGRGGGNGAGGGNSGGR